MRFPHSLPVWLGAAASLSMSNLTFAQQPGDILWIREANSYSQGPRPSVAADGTIYWNPTGTMYAISPNGQIIWSASPSGDLNGGHVAIGDGVLYTANYMAVSAFSAADGSPLWQFTDLGVTPGILGGPDVGPDGNIYAVTDGGIGMFSLTPTGQLRWTIPGWGNNGGSPGSEIVFDDDHLYKAENFTPVGMQGLLAITFDGDIDWNVQLTVGSGGATRSPRISPLTGNIHVGLSLDSGFLTFSPDGDMQWSHLASGSASSTFGVAVGPDGVVYYVTESKTMYAVNPNGSQKWVKTGVIPVAAWPNVPEVSPDGDVVVFGTDACFGAACPGRVAGVDAATGDVLWNIALPNQNGQVMAVRGRPRFSPDGSVVYVTVSAFAANDNKAYLFAIAADPRAVLPGDVTGDALVNVADLLAVLNAWGQCAAPCAPDVNGDGFVNVLDLLTVIQNWTS